MFVPVDYQVKPHVSSMERLVESVGLFSLGSIFGRALDQGKVVLIEKFLD